MLRGSIDLPLSENVLTKFSAYYVDTDGYLENRTDGKDYNEADLTGIRAALRWLISDSMTWDIAVDGGKSEVANIHGFLDGDDRYSLSVLGDGLPMGGGMSDYGNEVDTLNITSNLAWDAMGGTANLIFGSRSMGAVLLCAGEKGKRSGLTHSRVMIHQPLGGAQGQASDIEITAREILILKEELYQIISKHSGQTYDKVYADSDRDYWMKADKALEYGMIDEILSRK